MRLSSAGTMIATALLVMFSTGGWASAQEPPAPQPSPAAVPSAATAPAVYVEGIRVEVDGKARYAGNLSMEFTAQGRDPKLVSVNVLPKMKGDDIAEDLYKELTLAAGSDFKVKCKGNRVTIERANKKAPNLSLKVTTYSVLGVSVLLDKD